MDWDSSSVSSLLCVVESQTFPWKKRKDLETRQRSRQAQQVPLFSSISVTGPVREARNAFPFLSSHSPTNRRRRGTSVPWLWECESERKAFLVLGPALGHSHAGERGKGNEGAFGVDPEVVSKQSSGQPSFPPFLLLSGQSFADVGLGQREEKDRRNASPNTLST